MRIAIIALISLATLAGCGHKEPDRMTGGAAAGAGTGAAIGIVAGPPGMVVGALVGGAVGAGTGAAVPANKVNLGPPPWSDSRH